MVSADLPPELATLIAVAMETVTCPQIEGTCGAGLLVPAVVAAGAVAAQPARRHHCANEDPSEEFAHHCSCGASWQDVVIPHGDDACGAVPNGKHDADHFHVCNLIEHNGIQHAGQAMRAHACQFCGHGWAAP